MPQNYKMFRKPVNRAIEPKRPRIGPLGGAVPAVQKRFIRGQDAAEKKEFPAMMALIYQPPAIVHTPVEILEWEQPGGMVDRLYQPAAEKPRALGAKLQNWIKTGRFA